MNNIVLSLETKSDLCIGIQNFLRGAVDSGKYNSLTLHIGQVGKNKETICNNKTRLSNFSSLRVTEENCVFTIYLSSSDKGTVDFNIVLGDEVLIDDKSITLIPKSDEKNNFVKIVLGIGYSKPE